MLSNVLKTKNSDLLFYYAFFSPDVANQSSRLLATTDFDLLGLTTNGLDTLGLRSFFCRHKAIETIVLQHHHSEFLKLPSKQENTFLINNRCISIRADSELASTQIDSSREENFSIFIVLDNNHDLESPTQILLKLKSHYGIP